MAWTDDDLGAAALGTNDQQHGDDRKLGSADPHMLAAYCFDCMRKLHYLYVGLRLQMEHRPSFDGTYAGVKGPRDLARIIRNETQMVEDAAKKAEPATRADDWAVRARALEAIIIEQFRAIQADHAGLLDHFGLEPISYASRHGESESAR
jgi:hypothetical protein